MRPFLGLFSQQDLIARQEPPDFLSRFFIKKEDSEHYISKSLHNRILSSLTNPRREIGGNAGNAAVTLSEIGMYSVLSCPRREKSFMESLSKHKIFLIKEGKEISPVKCSRNEKTPEHIIFEMDGYRKIFNYDVVQQKFILDMDFWNSIKKAGYLFLSGFHTVPEKHMKKVNEIADFLEKRSFKVHLELGFGKDTVKYSAKKLIDRNCIDSVGMNDTETDIIGITKAQPNKMAENALAFLEKTGIERISIHSREYRLIIFRRNLQKNLRAAEFSIDVCAAKALGNIKDNLENARSVPFSGVQLIKQKNFFIIPSRIVEKPKIIVGMGDAAAVTESYYALKK
ncbi:MAG: ADP-dependent glucokinase/phosphofructokinase [Candidatus Aenigmatarchaeota archaeon]